MRTMLILHQYIVRSYHEYVVTKLKNNLFTVEVVSFLILYAAQGITAIFLIIGVDKVCST